MKPPESYQAQDRNGSTYWIAECEINDHPFIAEGDSPDEAKESCKQAIRDWKIRNVTAGAVWDASSMSGRTGISGGAAMGHSQSQGLRLR